MKTYNANKFATLLVFMTAVALLSGLVSANNELSIANLGITPQPVIAGDNITISFQIYNSYTSITNVDLSLTGSYPLLNYSPTGTQFISSIGNGEYGGTGDYFTYHLQIPKNIQSGTYTLNVVATYQIITTTGGTSTTSTASSTMPISFYVSGSPNLVLSATPTSSLVPGSTISVSLQALNTGTASATNVSATILNSSNFSISGTYVFNLGSIAAGSGSTATVTLISNRSLMQGSSYLPVKLTYITQYGTNLSRVEKVPLSVLISEPSLVASEISSQPQTLYSGSNQTITVGIQNIGVGIAKNVSVKFLSTQNITVGSSAVEPLHWNHWCRVNRNRVCIHNSKQERQPYQLLTPRTDKLFQR